MAAMPAPKQTLYQILGVAPDAPQAEIDAAYQRRAAELQDTPHDPAAASIARQAYDVLRHPERRRAYDAAQAAARERAAVEEAEPEVIVPATEVEPRKQRLSWPMLAALAALAIVVMYYALRPARLPDPQQAKPAPAAEAPAPQPATPPPPPRERTAAEVLKDAVAAAGLLSSVEMSGLATPLGVAFATEPGTMVTTCHGIPAGSKLVVKLGKETFPADLAITDELLDLCRLTVAGLSAKPVSVAREEPAAGTKIFALGVNAAGEFALTEGTVKQVRKTPQGNLLELSMPIAPAGSGGAVFDAQGRVVGIATTQYRDVKGNSLALPAAWIPQMRSRGAT